MAENIFDGIEIPEELLEGIAGGMSEEARSAAYNACVLLKERGTSLERALEIFSKTDDPELRAEVLAYINEIWPIL
jgi:hypothetical protein